MGHYPSADRVYIHTTSGKGEEGGSTIKIEGPIDGLVKLLSA